MKGVKSHITYKKYWIPYIVSDWWLNLHLS